MLQQYAKRSRMCTRKENLLYDTFWCTARMLRHGPGQAAHALDMLQNIRKCFIMLVHKQNALLRDSYCELPGVGRGLTKRDLCSEKATIVRQPPE